MKITISYKQSWVEELELKQNLWFFREQLEKLWHETFIYYLDADSSLEAEEINKIVLENIKNSDVIIWFINHKIKSEWQLLELGMSYSLWKKIFLFVQNNIKDNYFLCYGLNAEIFYFDDLIDFNLKNIFNKNQ